MWLLGAIASSLPGTSGPGALLAGYLRQSTVQDAPGSEQGAGRLGTVTVDLVTALCQCVAPPAIRMSSPRDAAVLSTASSPRAARDDGRQGRAVPSVCSGV